jgi:translation initiation factor IF-1
LTLRSAPEPTRNTAARAPAFRGRTRAEDCLTRDDHVQLDGLVTQVFAGGQFEVKTDAGAIVRAQLSGRMRKNRIRVILGDRVTVALSPYDLTHGMITYRHK